jgi:hypothetical protein
MAWVTQQPGAVLDNEVMWPLQQLPYQVCTAAAKGGSTDILQYLQQQVVFTAELLTAMLNAAGAHSKLAAAQWLLQQGAEFLCSVYIGYATCWSGEALAWARAQGCTAPAVQPKNGEKFGSACR